MSKAVKPAVEQDLRRFLSVHFGTRSLRALIAVAQKVQEERGELWDEMDADYEMGRGAKPDGYMKRRGS